MANDSVSNVALLGPALGVVGVVKAAVYAYRVFVSHTITDMNLVLLWASAVFLVIAFATLPLIRNRIHAARMARHAEGQRALEALEQNMRRLSTNWMSQDDDPRILDKMKASIPPPKSRDANVESIATFVKIVYPIYGLALVFVISQFLL